MTSWNESATCSAALPELPANPAAAHRSQRRAIQKIGYIVLNAR
jgi:hypothetical protein